MAQGRIVIGTAIKQLQILIVSVLWLCTCAAGGAVESPDSIEAKAKLAAVRARIGELTRRVKSELEQRDALNARLREADLSITAKRRRLESLGAQELAAERQRNELRAEEARNQMALDSQRAALAAQVRAAFLIGQADELKLLLNQTNPADVGRMLAYYGYFARARSAKIAQIDGYEARLQDLVAQIGETAARLKSLKEEAGREVLDLERARRERAFAVTALSARVESGNEELIRLKREEQAVESLVADLGWISVSPPTGAIAAYPSECDCRSALRSFTNNSPPPTEISHRSCEPGVGIWICVPC